ncbi:hypothetical protein [Hyphomonas oceanitis]|uniref:hypothetical protein n=1 Tax=Hyphomonas oceanitis TaxID=81033 RepID=UPI003001E050
MVWLSIPILMILFTIAWLKAPNSPSTLEVQQNQSDQHCIQYISTGDDSQTDSGPVNEMYEWRCESDRAPQYKINSSNERAHTATDANLLAQERVAYWTAWIGGFTAFGLIALVLTFIETRRMTEATKEVALLENRAWIRIRLDREARLTSLGNDGAIFGASVEVKNLGTGVATNITIYTKFLVTPYEDGPSRDLPDIDAGVKTKSAETFSLFPGDHTSKTIGNWEHECNPQSGPHTYHVLVIAEYNLSFDPPGATPRVTDAAFQLVTGMGWNIIYPDHFVEPEPDPTTQSSDGTDSTVLFKPYRNRVSKIT